MDGSKEMILSDTSWKIYRDGPIQHASIYDGEAYDGHKEQTGWDSPGFNDSGWGNTTIDSSVHITLSAQMDEPVKIVQKL